MEVHDYGSGLLLKFAQYFGQDLCSKICHITEALFAIATIFNGYVNLQDTFGAIRRIEGNTVALSSISSDFGISLFDDII